MAAAVFLCLVGASLGTLMLHGGLPIRYHSEETNGVVRLVTNILVVMTSLVLGLMVSSAKTTFEAVDRDVHAIATEIILFDRALRDYGREADAMRGRLLAYVERLQAPGDAMVVPPLVGDRLTEQHLLEISASLKAIKPADSDRDFSWQQAWQHFENMVEVRWDLVEQAEGTIPRPLIVIVVLWLILIFGSFGYRAPRNIVVGGSLVLGSAVIASAIYLILDLDVPFEGLIRVSPGPLNRVIAELRS